MTALRKYQRLECGGLWRESPQDQRREVLVRFEVEDSGIGVSPQEQEKLFQLQAHIFFDDQDVHLEAAANLVPSGKVPYLTQSVLSGLQVVSAE